MEIVLGILLICVFIFAIFSSLKVIVNLLRSILSPIAHFFPFVIAGIIIVGLLSQRFEVVFFAGLFWLTVKLVNGVFPDENGWN